MLSVWGRLELPAQLQRGEPWPASGASGATRAPTSSATTPAIAASSSAADARPPPCAVCPAPRAASEPMPLPAWPDVPAGAGPLEGGPPTRAGQPPARRPCACASAREAARTAANMAGGPAGAPRSSARQYAGPAAPRTPACAPVAPSSMASAAMPAAGASMPSSGAPPATLPCVLAAMPASGRRQLSAEHGRPSAAGMQLHVNSELWRVSHAGCSRTRNMSAGTCRAPYRCLTG